MSNLFSAIIKTDRMPRLTGSDQGARRDQSSRRKTSFETYDATLPRAAGMHRFSTNGPAGKSQMPVLFKCLLSNWIAGLSSMMLVTAMFLTVFCVIGWWNVAFIYVSVMGATAFLACLAYILGVDE